MVYFFSKKCCIMEKKEVYMNTIFTRRSIRRFENKPVETEKLDRIVRAGMQAPSAHNRQPWEFLVITDEDAKKAAGKMTP